MSERSAKSATMRVKLRYATIDQFLVKYGPNISRGGVFIATKAPKAVGTLIRFEFVLVNGEVEASVLSGEGVVHFVRDAETTPAKAPGMGVKFTKLYDEGQALIDRALRLRAASEAPPAPPSDLPQGVREVTGEVELLSGPHAALEPAPPDVPKPTDPANLPSSETTPVDMLTEAMPALPRDMPLPDHEHVADVIETLLAESGVDESRVNALLERRKRPRPPISDEDIEALRQRAPIEEATAEEAVARIDSLLRRR